MPETVEQDLKCAKCRYNLRGLPVDGRCPECGVAVLDTISAGRQRTTWQRCRCCVVGALCLAALHLMVVGIPLIRAGGGGESQAITILCYDFPLYLFMKTRGNLNSMSGQDFVLTFTIGGTLMHAAFGAVIGFLVGKLGRGKRD